jgi:DNA-binding IclR family transcriptional regulator
MVLARHPSQLTATELARELGAASERRSDRLDVDRAVDALVDSGLLRRQGDLVLPTPAALHFDRLLGG